MYLTLGDRLRAICRVECEDRHEQICNDFDSSMCAIQCIMQCNMKWKSQGRQGSILSVNRALFPKYQEVDAEIQRFKISLAVNVYLLQELSFNNEQR